MKINKLILLLVLLVGGFLRFWQLNRIPPALNWDEAALGWNAKTIFETRRDEFGTRLPLSFRSFGDYKAPLYIYLTAPVVGILGSSAFSVRLVSVLSGLASIGLIYLISQELWPKKTNWLAAPLSALLLSITPWHILLSRPALEANLALMLVLGGIWFFLKGVKHGGWLSLAATSFGLSFYAYHSPKIFIPIFLLGTSLIYFKKIFSEKNLAWLILAVGLGLGMLLPLVEETVSAQGARRFKGTSIFYNQAGELKTVNGELISHLGKNYLIHFSPTYLFLGSQDNPRIGMKKIGPLLLIEAPFLLIGLAVLVKSRKNKSAQFLGWWFLSGPIAAAVGFEVPHQIRSAPMLPAVIIIIGLGLATSFKWLTKSISVKRAVCLLVGLFLVNFGYFFYRYFWQYPIYGAADWQYGHRQVAQLAQKYEGEVDKILMTSTYGQPHIFMLFFQNRDPQQVFWGAMAKYLYRDIKWDEDRYRQNWLIIGSSQEIPAGAEGIIKEVAYPDGSVAFRVVKT